MNKEEFLRRQAEAEANQTVAKKGPEEHVFAESLLQSLRPYRKLMRAIFLFPFSISTNSRTGVFHVDFNPYSPFTLGFHIIMVVSVLFCIWYGANLLGILLNFPHPRNVTFQLANGSFEVYPEYVIRGQELYILQRNIIPAVVTAAILFQAGTSTLEIFKRRGFFCDYFNFWLGAVEQVRIDAAQHMYKSMMIRLAAQLSFVFLVAVFAITHFIPVVTGMQSIACMIMFRAFSWVDPHGDGNGWAIHLSPHFPYYRVILAVLLLYMTVAARAYIILYAWTCQLLKQSYSVWNNRLDRVIRQGESDMTRADKVANRTGYDHLFKDHVCLLDLTEGADILFSAITRGFYGTEIVTICLLFFHAWRSQQAIEEFNGGRRFDGILMMIFVINSLYFLVTVSWSAAYVAEEAMNGLEIVRRKGLLGITDTDEMYFMLSIYTSFTGHFETGLHMGGVADVNKGFLVAVFGTAISYSILLFQFTPPLAYRNEEFIQYWHNSNLTVKEWELIELTEISPNPFDYGQTFIRFDRFAADWDPNQADPWDFLHAPDFLAYFNLTNSSL